MKPTSNLDSEAKFEKKFIFKNRYLGKIENFKEPKAKKVGNPKLVKENQYRKRLETDF